MLGHFDKSDFDRGHATERKYLFKPEVCFVSKSLTKQIVSEIPLFCCVTRQTNMGTATDCIKTTKIFFSCQHCNPSTSLPMGTSEEKVTEDAATQQIPYDRCIKTVINTVSGLLKNAAVGCIKKDSQAWANMRSCLCFLRHVLCKQKWRWLVQVHSPSPRACRTHTYALTYAHCSVHKQAYVRCHSIR